MLARAVERGTTLNDYLLATPPTAEVRRLGLRLAAHVARLHEAGFQARDLHGWNVLLRETPAGLDLCFVDLDEMRELGVAPMRHAAGDLARLGVLAPVKTFTRLRFLANYLRARRIPRAQWRRWLAAVARHAARLASNLKDKYGREPEEFVRWFAAERRGSEGARGWSRC